MLYKASTTPALDKRRPVQTRTRAIVKVAQALGVGSEQRAVLAFAKEYPKEFWTQLYAKTIERGPDTVVNNQAIVVQIVREGRKVTSG
jgi:hypothetical protein